LLQVKSIIDRIEELAAQGVGAFDIQRALLAELTPEEREALALRELIRRISNEATVQRLKRGEA
jgi:hypothetical protein